ncbi:Crp/Fnr family transcriptional regulator [Maribellus sp. YY47]|uniref:Crp/Fnr family transcriptional regulator n=1 Tax=Maribellus sp. YY47 TaxID=2929486 RepID=UPI0020014E46|nr:Crp/Fnr family transcriptional regulator [Maribellus sp. YY47]MCK3683260.1 Crp/Fnr family transcriptional regulator [Maribellus sp. YY47]
MCEIMRFYEVSKGTKLLDYMRVERAVRFLGKGIVKCEDHFNGKSFVYDFRVAPIILCETVSFFNVSPSRITLEAVTDCEFIELPGDPFFPLIYSNPDLAKFAINGVANYLGMTHYKVALLRTMSADKRYKQFLREFPEVAKYCELKDISSYLNITPQSLSRIRKTIKWAENEKALEALSNELEVVYKTYPASSSEM